ncbi:response regulator transcription factor [Kordia algicida OT-1]|uniref:Putative transcriptional regulator n=1 Tax=Kordia algicida OT-1 TaxID=391587 RepID=A9ECT9_9FLAO|nr:response regulator transcription factor [Kordia algicida]EDP94312.1 putative transcriptional regulator [Kordia algicida OT-1]
MKHKFLIIEDDPFIAINIKNVLEMNAVEVVGMAKTIEEARDLLKETKPDVCLIDIQLQGDFDGVLFAKELDKIQLPYFYLTAQTDPLTLAEVEHTRPLGYLVKPFTNSGLWSSISVVWNKYLSEKGNTLIVKSDGYIYKIPETDILYLEAFDNYCYIHLTEKKLLVPHTLKKIREQLKGNHFFTPHRSYYINTNKITNVGKKAVFINTNEITLSEARRAELLQIVRNS